MTLEKSSKIQVTQAEINTVKAGNMPERLESLGYSKDELRQKIQEGEVEKIDPPGVAGSSPNQMEPC